MSSARQKILFVITKAVGGGAQKYVFDLATALKDTSDIVLVYGTPGELSENLSRENVRTMHIESLGRDINPLLDISTFFELIEIFKKEKPDIVHLNSSKIGGLGAVAGRMAGVKKIIFTAHGWAFNEDRNIFSKTVIWILSWLTSLFATHVIVLGEKEKEQALNMPFISSQKISLIRLGIDVPDFEDRVAARKHLARILNKPEDFFQDKMLVGSVSELTNNKGLGYALNAFSHIPNCTYVIVGGGEEERELKEEIENKNLEEKIFLAGFVKNASRLLKAFDIFLLPSVKEGLPYTLLEAGLAGLPVVGTSVGAIPEVIKSHVSGILIKPKKTDDIISSVTSLLHSSEKRIRYGQTLKKIIEEKYSKSDMIEKTKNIYS